MACLVALLRAVNVGGTGRLLMNDLVRLCGSCGFTDVRTYIQSGNVVFRSRLSAGKAGAVLEDALAEHLGARVSVLVRDAAELQAVLADNPFPDAPPAKVAVFFAPARLNAPDFANVAGAAGEEVVVHGRELYVRFPEGMGRSKLKLPKSLGRATARNLNTVRKLVAMCGP